MAVIKDVAKLAGVSVGTVSKYLNSPESLRENKRIVVEDAIKKLNYTPNLFARNLRVQSSRTIAVIAQEISNPFHATLYNTIRKEALKYNYSVVLYSVNDVDGDINSLFKTLPIRYYSGIILCYFHDMEKSLDFAKMHNDVPTVIMSNDSRYFEEYDSRKIVYSDFGSGIKKACRYLVDLGNKQIAYVGCMTKANGREPKYRSFQKAMTEMKMEPHSVVRLQKEYTMETGYESAELILQHDTLPDAILVDTDIMAVGVLRCLKDHKLKVPEDLMITGFDDIAISSYSCPALTTLHVPIEEMSVKAVQRLILQIDNQEVEVEDEEFNIELVVRETTR